MGKRITKELEIKIINEYNSGKSVTKVGQVLNLNKRTISNVLKRNDVLIRNNNIDYSETNFTFNGEKWEGVWICKSCGNHIKAVANTKYYLARNIKNKTTCKKCSTTGEKNPFYGQKHSSKTINKISKAKIGIKPNLDTKDPIYRQKIKDGLRKFWDSPKSKVTRKILSDNLKQRIKDGKFKGYIRSKAEFEIIELLRSNGYKVIPNFRIDTKIFDMYLPDYNLLIEYNGDYWHCNPSKFSSDYVNQKKNKTAKEIWDYDRDKLYLAEINDYNTITIWESDYKNNKNIILDKLNKYDKQKRNHTSSSQNKGISST